jgi:5-methylcytosine-specific restriction endonuclease McrA
LLRAWTIWQLEGPSLVGCTDRIPARVRREVFLRDGGRCQVPLASGDVCGSTWRVQLGHIIARTLGGPPTVENLRCECEAHNQRAADRDFGKAFMDGFRLKRRRTG